MAEQVIANPIIKVNVDFASVNGQMNQVRNIVAKQGKHIEQSLSKSFIPISNAAIKMGRSINQALKAITVPLAGAGIVAVKKLFDSNTKAGEEAKKKWASFKTTFDSSMSRIGYYITQSKVLGRTMWDWLDKFSNLLKRVSSQDIQRMVDLLTKAAITMGLIKGAIVGTKFAQGTLKAIELLGKGAPVSMPLSAAHQAASLGGGSALGSAIGTEIAAKAIAKKTMGGEMTTAQISAAIASALGRPRQKEILNLGVPSFMTNTMLSNMRNRRVNMPELLNFGSPNAGFGSPNFNPLTRMNQFKSYGYPGGGIGTALGAALGTSISIPKFNTNLIKITKYGSAAAAVLIAWDQLFRQLDRLLQSGEFTRYGVNIKSVKDGLMDLGSAISSGTSFVGNAIEAAITLLSDKIGTSIGNIISSPDSTNKIRSLKGRDYLSMFSPLAFLFSGPNKVDLGGKEWYKPFTPMTEREARDMGISEKKRLAYNERLQNQQEGNLFDSINMNKWALNMEDYSQRLMDISNDISNEWDKQIEKQKELASINRTLTDATQTYRRSLEDLDDNYRKSRKAIRKQIQDEEEDMKKMLGYTGEKVDITELTDFATKTNMEWQKRTEEYNKRMKELAEESKELNKEHNKQLAEIKDVLERAEKIANTEKDILNNMWIDSRNIAKGTTGGSLLDLGNDIALSF